MMGSRFGEEQIIEILREQKAGAKTRRSVDATGSRRRFSINGRLNAADLMCRRRAG